jgi:predicted ester cyclase
MFATLDRGDVEAFKAIVRDGFTPDAETVEVVGTFHGPDEVLPYWIGYTEAFSNVRHEFRTVVEQPNLVVYALLMTGDNTGPIPAPDGTLIPPTGRHVELPHVTVVNHDGDRISGWRTYMDQLGLMAQFGLMQQATAG